MNEIQQNRYDQLLRRVGGLIGPGAKVAEVLSELFPMFDVENLPGELYKLSGTDLAFGGVASTGGIGTFGSVDLVNPVDSGVLMTMTRAIVSLSTSGDFRFTMSATPPTGIESSARVRDTRQGAVNAPVGQVFRDNIAANIAQIGIIRTGANLPYTFEDPNGPTILAPGTRFIFAANTTNVPITVTFFWRERAAVSSELNL